MLGQSMLAVFQLVKNICSRLLQCLQHAAAMRLNRPGNPGD